MSQGIVNSWHIYPGLTAEFGPEDFERWWLAGMDRNDRISADNREEMLEAMLYIAEAEGREMIQTIEQLKDAIDRWADEWNARILRTT